MVVPCVQGGGPDDKQEAALSRERVRVVADATSSGSCGCTAVRPPAPSATTETGPQATTNSASKGPIRARDQVTLR